MEETHIVTTSENMPGARRDDPVAAAPGTRDREDPAPQLAIFFDPAYRTATRGPG
jgi:hypothetical protein